MKDDRVKLMLMLIIIGIFSKIAAMAVPFFVKEFAKEFAKEISTIDEMIGCLIVKKGLPYVKNGKLLYPLRVEALAPVHGDTRYVTVTKDLYEFVFEGQVIGDNDKYVFKERKSENVKNFMKSR